MSNQGREVLAVCDNGNDVPFEGVHVIEVQNPCNLSNPLTHPPEIINNYHIVSELVEDQDLRVPHDQSNEVLFLELGPPLQASLDNSAC